MRNCACSLVKAKDIIRNLIPTVNETHHKGSLGRICVVGGSELYCGAPYFAALSALRMGADLSYIVCPKEAAIPIKCYSPDMMVLPYLDNDGKIDSILKLINSSSSVVLGPGLGREPSVIKPLKTIMEFLHVNKKNVVVDADALWPLSYQFGLPSIRSFPSTFVMTPNRNELKRLVTNFELEETDIDDQIFKLAKLTGMNVFFKDNVDIFCDSKQIFSLNDSTFPQCYKRCGGQGDILGGVLALFMTWHNLKNHQTKIGDENDSALLECAVAASTLVKLTAHETFNDKGLSMCAEDIIRNFGPILKSM